MTVNEDGGQGRAQQGCGERKCGEHADSRREGRQGHTVTHSESIWPEKLERIRSYVAVDLETTGLDPKKDKIIEIGALRVENDRIVEEFSAFVNPWRQLEPRIVEITGITDAMLKDAPGIEAVIGPFIHFCGELPILGHHVIFDYSFLKRACINCGISFEKEGIDTLTLCRRFMPAKEKKNLAAASLFFGVTQEGAHRAFEDAKTAHLLYQAIAERHFCEESKAFNGKTLIYRVKKEQPATKKQKEGLRDLIKYHKICLTVQIDHLTRNEASRMADKIVSQYGRIKRGE